MRSMLAPALPVQAADGEGEDELLGRIGLRRVVAAGGDGEWVLGAREVAVAMRLAGERAELEMDIGDLARASCSSNLSDGLLARHDLTHVHGDGLEVAVGAPASEGSGLDDHAVPAADGGVDHVAHDAVGHGEHGRSRTLGEVDSGMSASP